MTEILKTADRVIIKEDTTKRTEEILPQLSTPNEAQMAEMMEFFNVRKTDYNSVSKLGEIWNWIKDIDDNASPLEESIKFDLNLANQGRIARLDKIYTHLKLDRETRQRDKVKKIIQEKERKNYLKERIKQTSEKMTEQLNIQEQELLRQLDLIRKKKQDIYAKTSSNI